VSRCSGARDRIGGAEWSGIPDHAASRPRDPCESPGIPEDGRVLRPVAEGCTGDPESHPHRGRLSEAARSAASSFSGRRVGVGSVECARIAPRRKRYAPNPGTTAAEVSCPRRESRCSGGEGCPDVRPVVRTLRTPEYRETAPSPPPKPMPRVPEVRYTGRKQLGGSWPAACGLSRTSGTPGDGAPGSLGSFHGRLPVFRNTGTIRVLGSFSVLPGVPVLRNTPGHNGYFFKNAFCL
jgi:hypothetical protein